VYKNVLEMIGNTQMIKLNNLLFKKGINIYAKIEGNNPGGSIKDRIAYRMIKEAVKSGELTKDKTIIEATSGNTGIGLAMVSAILGYKIEIVMSKAVSDERRKMMKAFGADIVLTEAKLGTDGAIKKARELKNSNPDKYYMPDQFSNKYNKIAHYKTTAEEIWNQMNGNIDYFVSSIGTSGTIMGVSKYLKEKNPDIKVVCAHPVKGHYIQGLKNMEEAIVPALYNPDKIDITIMVESEAAFNTARELVIKEGLLMGMSSGAALFAALELSKNINKGNIVVIFPDRGEKYLSTKLFT
jgi:S-sulfo-L-cysteine synthase (O-acetyl-L-serine-dependent)